ncbi:MAG: peptide chain release factor N(5)-glutamine methyltransferase [Proteobacteria bacterium]|nr:peptide chain release factor N(5)-glutamine methyltransferase [Pseudomonadota bacterium]
MKAQTFFQSLYQQFNCDLNCDKREVDLIICHVLNLNTAGLFVCEKELSLKEKQQITKLLKQRIQGKPLAYITGIKPFWNLDFKVNKHTLIPRPETELIVELFLKWTDEDYTGKILDLGTGSGAIALSIANERPNCQVTATDLSPECIQIAKYNQQKHKITNADIFQSDWFNQITATKFDYVISNPPYIAEGDIHLDNLSYEPISALTALDNGCKDLKTIIENARNYLTVGGKLMLEHGYDQHDQVQVLLRKNGYTDIFTHNDLAGIPRITSARHINFARY